MFYALSYLCGFLGLSFILCGAAGFLSISPQLGAIAGAFGIITAFIFLIAQMFTDKQLHRGHHDLP